MYVRVLALSLLFFAVRSPAASAQFYSGAFIQQLVASPHVQALGEATVGLRGYPGAAQLNPASIGRTDMVQASTAFHPGEAVFLKTRWLPGFFGEAGSLFVVAPSIDVKLGPWAFGYMYREFSFGTFEVRDGQNNPAGSARSFDAVHKVTAAYEVSDELTIGLSLNHVASRLGVASVGSQRRRAATAFSLDLGVFYRYPLETEHVRIDPAVGWSLTDFGTKLHYEGSDAAPLPMHMRGGASVQISTQYRPLSRPLVSVTLLGALSQEIEQVEVEQTPEGVDVEYVNPFVALFTGWKPIEVRTNSTSDEIPEIESINAWEQMRRHAGIEFSFWDVLFLRWGSQHEHPRLGPRSFTSTGWGIDLYYVAFERASVKDELGSYRDYTTSTLTVRVPLGKAEENFWIPLWRRIVR